MAARLAGGLSGDAGPVWHHGLVRSHLYLLGRAVSHIGAEHGPGRLLSRLQVRRNIVTDASAAGEKTTGSRPFGEIVYRQNYDRILNTFALFSPQWGWGLFCKVGANIWHNKNGIIKMKTIFRYLELNRMVFK